MNTAIILVALLAAAVAYGIFLAAYIRNDGHPVLGRRTHREPPRSHVPDLFDPHIRRAV